MSDTTAHPSSTPAPTRARFWVALAVAVAVAVAYWRSRPAPMHAAQAEPIAEGASLSNYALGRVRVAGAVRNPGPYELPAGRLTTLADLLTMAGGFDSLANSADVRVIRQLPDGTAKIWTFNLKEMLRGQAGAHAPAAMFLLKPSDSVFVPQVII